MKLRNVTRLLVEATHAKIVVTTYIDGRPCGEHTVVSGPAPAIKDYAAGLITFEKLCERLDVKADAPVLDSWCVEFTRTNGP